ncbi:hypothetical protein AVEN_157840-1 [Araneus ventricosus]|uniref:Uncharacterized protein n=1 Tax=Araneus ventricosus TaxID=182803 RepID=A0A4Y2E755_ARAVE|nr:hypothetical protein AVEN_157840-1 [Araneus ventricosus]
MQKIIRRIEAATTRIYKQFRQFVRHCTRLCTSVNEIEEERISLQPQRESGRPGHLGGVDKKLTDKEERAKVASSCQRRKSANHICFRFNILGVIRTIARRFLFEL